MPYIPNGKYSKEEIDSNTMAFSKTLLFILYDGEVRLYIIYDIIILYYIRYISQTIK